MNSKFNDIKKILVCPIDKKNLIFKKKYLLNPRLKIKYKILNNQIFFNKNKSTISDDVKQKNYFKNKLGEIYYILLKFFGPTFPYDFKKIIKNNFNLSNQIILNLGSGNSKIHDKIINIDFEPYSNVDLVCDCTNLPFKKNSVDGIISRSFIEHINNPFKMSDEIFRCLKTNGKTIHSVPFLYPVHASPNDYSRFTVEGFKTLIFKKFKFIDSKILTGPFTLINLILIEIFSTIFSIFNLKLKKYFYIFFMMIFFPIKYLDYFFIKKNIFENIATSIYIKFKK